MILNSAVERDIERLTERLPDHRRETIASAVLFNCRSWDELVRKDAELAKIEIGIAWCARIMVTEQEGSPQYAQAKAEDWRLRDQRYELWQRRAAAEAAA